MKPDQRSGTVVVCGFPVRWHGTPPTIDDLAVIRSALASMVADVIDERLREHRAAR